jgi:hypothetical protein
MKKLLSYESAYSEIIERDKLNLKPEIVNAYGRGINQIDYPGYDINECVHMQKVEFVNANQVYIPQYGYLDLNSWSQRNIQQKTGVNIAKFLAKTPELVAKDTMQQNLKFNSSDPEYIVKCVVREFKRNEEPKNASSVGILRAFVSPSYSPITDHQVFTAIKDSVSYEMLSNISFYDIGHEDKGSDFMVIFNEVIKIDGQEHYFGFKVRNSEVGARALSISTWLVRLICTNGMVTGIKENLLKIRHFKINQENIKELLKDVVQQILKAKKGVIEFFKRAKTLKVEQPIAVLQSLLVKYPRYIIDAAVEAYNKEPDDTVYGIAQTVARVGVAIFNNQDLRFKLETLAGKFVNSKINEIPEIIA